MGSLSISSLFLLLLQLSHYCRFPFFLIFKGRQFEDGLSCLLHAFLGGFAGILDPTPLPFRLEAMPGVRS